MDQDKSFLSMSLDEYIAKMGNDIDNSTSTSNSRNDDKFERRSKHNYEEEDEDALLKTDSEEEKEEVDLGVWKRPEAPTAATNCQAQQKDLRDKLKNINNNEIIRMSPNGVRVIPSNNITDTASNIPLLLPVIPQRKGRYNRKQRHLNNQNLRNLNHRNYNRNGLNDGNNRGFHRDRNEDLRNNMSINNSRNLKGIQNESAANNLRPFGPTNPFQVPKSEERRSMPIGGITPQAQAVLDLETGHKPVSGTNTDNLRSVLGFQGAVTQDMMPVFTSRLIEYIQKEVEANKHKPIYDMKLQKEIHEIQNKPMLYKCNGGGEVISSDGAGVSCKITPRTSGVSLNCRFS